MASENEASCIADPNFAVICSFLERFAESCGILHPNFAELQEMLENCEEVDSQLVDLHVKLLRKARKSVSAERWERALIKFGHSYSTQDGWELERFGYKRAALATKLRLLKGLLEAQFDLNARFKAAINKLTASELRSKPLGRDSQGQVYWIQQDTSLNLRVYREDEQEETWTLIARDRESLAGLISTLSGGRLDAEALAMAEGEDEEDEDELSSSLDEDGDHQEILLDTGQPEEAQPPGISAHTTNGVSCEVSGDAAPINNAKLEETKEITDSVSLVEQKIESEVPITNKTEDHSTGMKAGDNEKKLETTPAGGEQAVNCTVPSLLPSQGTKRRLEEPEPVDASKRPCPEAKELENEDEEFGEAIEEPLMLVTGPGAGAECDTGNPGENKDTERKENGEKKNESPAKPPKVSRWDNSDTSPKDQEKTGQEPSSSGMVSEWVRKEDMPDSETTSLADKSKVLGSSTSQDKSSKPSIFSPSKTSLWSIDKICGTSTAPTQPSVFSAGMLFGNLSKPSFASSPERSRFTDSPGTFTLETKAKVSEAETTKSEECETPEITFQNKVSQSEKNETIHVENVRSETKVQNEPTVTSELHKIPAVSTSTSMTVAKPEGIEPAEAAPQCSELGTSEEENLTGSKSDIKVQAAECEQISTSMETKLVEKEETEESLTETSVSSQLPVNSKTILSNQVESEKNTDTIDSLSKIVSGNAESEQSSNIEESVLSSTSVPAEGEKLIEDTSSSKLCIPEIKVTQYVSPQPSPKPASPLILGSAKSEISRSATSLKLASSTVSIDTEMVEDVSREKDRESNKIIEESEVSVQKLQCPIPASPKPHATATAAPVSEGKSIVDESVCEQAIQSVEQTEAAKSSIETAIDLSVDLPDKSKDKVFHVSESLSEQSVSVKEGNVHESGTIGCTETVTSAPFVAASSKLSPIKKSPDVSKSTDFDDAQTDVLSSKFPRVRGSTGTVVGPNVSSFRNTTDVVPIASGSSSYSSVMLQPLTIDTQSKKSSFGLKIPSPTFKGGRRKSLESISLEIMKEKMKTHSPTESRAKFEVPLDSLVKPRDDDFIEQGKSADVYVSKPGPSIMKPMEDRYAILEKRQELLDEYSKAREIAQVRKSPKPVDVCTTTIQKSVLEEKVQKSSQEISPETSSTEVLDTISIESKETISTDVKCKTPQFSAAGSVVLSTSNEIRIQEKDRKKDIPPEISKLQEVNTVTPEGSQPLLNVAEKEVLPDLTVESVEITSVSTTKELGEQTNTSNKKEIIMKEPHIIDETKNAQVEKYEATTVTETSTKISEINKPVLELSSERALEIESKMPEVTGDSSAIKQKLQETTEDVSLPGTTLKVSKLEKQVPEVTKEMLQSDRQSESDALRLDNKLTEASQFKSVTAEVPKEVTVLEENKLHVSEHVPKCDNELPSVSMVNPEIVTKSLDIPKEAPVLTNILIKKIQDFSETKTEPSELSTDEIELKNKLHDVPKEATKLENKSVGIPDLENKLSDVVEIKNNLSEIPKNYTKIEKLSEISKESAETVNKLSEMSKESTETVNKLPVMSREATEAVNRLPEMSRESTETVNKLPEMPREDIGIVKKLPEMSKETTETENKLLETSNKSTEMVSKLPEMFKKCTETVTNLPETPKESTETVTKLPETPKESTETVTTKLSEMSKESTATDNKLSEISKDPTQKNTTLAGSTEKSQLTESVLPEVDPKTSASIKEASLDKKDKEMRKESIDITKEMPQETSSELFETKIVSRATRSTRRAKKEKVQIQKDAPTEVLDKLVVKEISDTDQEDTTKLPENLKKNEDSEMPTLEQEGLPTEAKNQEESGPPILDKPEEHVTIGSALIFDYNPPPSPQDSSDEHRAGQLVIDDGATEKRPGRPQRAVRGRGRPGKRGPSAASVATSLEDKPSEASGIPTAVRGRGRGKGVKGRRVDEIAAEGADSQESNITCDVADAPVLRQSRRIAQLKQKEEEERRKQEAEALAEMQLRREQELKEQQLAAASSSSDESDESDSEKQAAVNGSRKKKKRKYTKRKKGTNDEDYIGVADEDIASLRKKKKRKKRKKKKRAGANPWESSDSSDTSSQSDGLEPEEEEEDDEPRELKSDHEFSPESDLELGPGEELQPAPRRARTARRVSIDKAPSSRKDKGTKEAAEEEPRIEEDEYRCQKCNGVDRPEWILLCDNCDNGWHTSCLKPELHLVPEGDWYCPPCSEQNLLASLTDTLRKLDKSHRRKTNQELRRQRLAYVGISLDNVLPARGEEEEEDEDAEDPLQGGDSAPSEAGSSLREAMEGAEGSGEEDESSGTATSSSESSSSSEEEGEEDKYPLRQRRAAQTVSYSFQAYDELINSAIQDDMEGAAGAGNAGRGKDIANIERANQEEEEAATTEVTPTADSAEASAVPSETSVITPAAEGEATKAEEEESAEEEEDEAEKAEDAERQRQHAELVKLSQRRKPRRLACLDVSSEDDHASDEDFHGSLSDEDEDDDEALDLDSDDSGANYRGSRGRGPVRRSTRARQTRYDREFIDDDSEDSEVERKRRKARRARGWLGSDDELEESQLSSESGESDWGGSRKRKRKAPVRTRSRAPAKRRKRGGGGGGGKKRRGAKKGKAPARKRQAIGSDSEGQQPRTAPKPKKPKPPPRDPSPEEEPQRRATRGRKINYQEIIGSDSDDAVPSRGKGRRIVSDDEDEFRPDEEDTGPPRTGKPSSVLHNPSSSRVIVPPPVPPATVPVPPPIPPTVTSQPTAQPISTPAALSGVPVTAATLQQSLGGGPMPQIVEVGRDSDNSEEEEEMHRVGVITATPTVVTSPNKRGTGAVRRNAGGRGRGRGRPPASAAASSPVLARVLSKAPMNSDDSEESDPDLPATLPRSSKHDDSEQSIKPPAYAPATAPVPPQYPPQGSQQPPPTSQGVISRLLQAPISPASNQPFTAAAAASIAAKFYPGAPGNPPPSYPSPPRQGPPPQAGQQSVRYPPPGAINYRPPMRMRGTPPNVGMAYPPPGMLDTDKSLTPPPAYRPVMSPQQGPPRSQTFQRGTPFQPPPPYPPGPQGPYFSPYSSVEEVPPPQYPSSYAPTEAFAGPQEPGNYEAPPSHGAPPRGAGADEESGEFGGLVSYFSSQREDDLES